MSLSYKPIQEINKISLSTSPEINARVSKKIKNHKKSPCICCARRSGKINKRCILWSYECLPARQVWTLSKILSPPNIFSISSLFANMDHFFWRIQPKMDDHQFAWILWYIWKAWNNKGFSNLDIDLRDTLQLAELESSLWTEAHVGNDPTRELSVQTSPPLATPGRWCFLDGSWKDNDLFSGQGWYTTLPGFDGL